MSHVLPIVDEVSLLCSNMYRLGWDERNGGNVSCLLDDCSALSSLRTLRSYSIDYDASALRCRYLLVTGSGKYFKNVERFPEDCLGIIRINSEGNGYSIVWGFSGGAMPTSELPTHIMAHSVRLTKGDSHTCVIHTHPTNTVAMTHVHSIDSRLFTRALWQMCTECLVVFPDGVGVLPYMLCGNAAIGEKSAELLSLCRLVVWAKHGILGTGRSLDEAFGLIETVEKAAELYMKCAHLTMNDPISDAELRELAAAFSVDVRKGYLD